MDMVENEVWQLRLYGEKSKVESISHYNKHVTQYCIISIERAGLDALLIYEDIW